MKYPFSKAGFAIFLTLVLISNFYSFPSRSSADDTSTFIKGINLNGDAVTIEGNSWMSYSSALSSGLSVSNASTWSGTYGFTLSPTADADTKTMLESNLHSSAPLNGQG